MKEIKSILELYDRSKKEGQIAALVQVVKVEESSYRREGARMLVYESGIFEGGISGGCLEGDALRKSQIAIAKRFPTVVVYDTTREDENSIGLGLGCDGLIEVLISPIDPEDPFQIETLRKCLSGRKAHILVTLTHTSLKREGLHPGQTFYYKEYEENEENEESSGSEKGCGSLENFPYAKHAEAGAFIQEQIALLKGSGRSRIVQYDQGDQSLRAFIEFFPPPIHLAVFGDNYDVYPLIRLAEALGWKISLVANLHKMSKSALASVDEIYAKDDSPRPLIDERTAVILMAHDYRTDCDNLARYADSAASYIGLLGPKKRFVKMEEELREKKILLKAKEKIFSPAGLEIGANFPEDIAMSILSEISAVFSGKEGGMLRRRESPIHDRPPVPDQH